MSPKLQSLASAEVPGTFISYAACSSLPAPTTPCPWTTLAQQQDPCDCINMDANMTAAQLAIVGSGYGSQCQAWDSTTCNRDNDPSTLGDWCCLSWLAPLLGIFMRLQNERSPISLAFISAISHQPLVSPHHW